MVVPYPLDPSENENEDSPADLMHDTIGVRQYLNRDNKTDSDHKTKPEESMPRTGNPPPPRIPRRLRSMFGAERNCPDQRESGQQAPRFKVQETSLASMKVCFDPQFRLESKGEKLWEVKSIKGAHVLSVPQGKGEITVLTDYDFMQNEQIGQADHADFLLALLAFTPGMTVWFIPREEVAGIMTLTWRYGWPALLALAAWLALTLWRTGARFGPLKPAPDATRRSIAEHIRANGEFLWRHGEAASLWQSTIADVKRRIERTLPPAHNRSDRDLLELLAKKSGLGIARLEQAFYPQAAPSAENFSRAISTLEYLRKNL